MAVPRMVLHLLILTQVSALLSHQPQDGTTALQALFLYFSVTRLRESGRQCGLLLAHHKERY